MDFGDAECCGCLNGIIADGLGKVVCNECGEVLRCVPPADLETTLLEMENGLDVVVDTCEYCGTVNRFSGFTQMLVWTCKNCGRAMDRA